MAKLTKTQKKRLVKEIESKAKKLYLWAWAPSGSPIIETKDMQAIEKMFAKFMKRIQ